MRKAILNRTYICICVFLLTAFGVRAQERIAPVNYNPFVKGASSPKAFNKTTALSLPFFEDFTGYDPLPDPSKWVDRSVYINNTMAFQPVSRGVATFDALNARGGPYDSSSNTALVYADSLTSEIIDLSSHTAADSIYLSFFYQPQGTGFSPETQDSLMLFLRNNNGDWIKLWAKEGTTLQPFRQVMIPVTNSAFFYNGFQFRFVNKASINLNDDVWNVDYIRMAAGRNRNDTAVNDVATTYSPSYLLNDYTSMPYRQFQADPAAALATQHYFNVRNNYTVQQSVNYGYTARESISNTPLFTSGLTNAALPALTQQQFTFPLYPISYNAPGPYDKVVLEDKYYISPVSASDPRENDTIVRDQVFDNYLAYDDGTAEKSYFLNEFATLPAKTAIEFNLKQADSLQGVAIYFGRTVPLASSKFFSVYVYKDIAINNGTDDVLYKQDLLFPGYVDTINHFWIYRFDTAVYVPAGRFYLGTVQPASSGSDSLYFGLDANRLGGNHLYYNVLDVWESSIISGALMIRPILGQRISGTGVDAIKDDKLRWNIYPNPAASALSIEAASSQGRFRYLLTDIQGRTLLNGYSSAGETIDVSSLSPGLYFIRILAGHEVSAPRKFIKL